MPPGFSDVKKILVIKLRHIGDVLLSVPTLRALKESFPGSTVSALVSSGTEDMLTGNPVVEEVITLDRTGKGLGPAGRARKELAFVSSIRSRAFDLTVDLTGGDRAAILGFSSGARYRLGWEPTGGFAGKKYLYTHRAPIPEDFRHTVLRDLGLVRIFGIDTADLAVDIYNSADDDRFVDKALRSCGLGPNVPFVHIHPTSRWLFKCWTTEGVAGVIDRLAGAGIRSVVTAGPDERERKMVREIIDRASAPVADLSGGLRLKHLAAVSRRAGLFFGVDTAPMHIAAAAGARVVALFGPSGAYDWGPWDNRAASSLAPGAGTPYPERNGIQRFGGNTVIQLPWDCVPCGRDGCEGTKKSDCLDKLDVDTVWEVLGEAVEDIFPR